MAFNINDIRAQMQYGGARPSLFQVTLTNPINGIADLKAPFMIRATSLPQWTLGVAPVSYFGREIKLAGSRKIESWNVTVYNDEDYLVRNAIEQWSNAINSLEGNLNTTGSAAPLNYKSQAIVTHYGKTGDIIRTYQFNGIWPSSVAGMELNWENGDEIQTFDVTFEVDTFEVVSTVTGNAGGK